MARAIFPMRAIFAPSIDSSSFPVGFPPSAMTIQSDKMMQASSTKVPDDDDDLIEYFNLLRESILEAYVGIVQGLQDGGLLNQFIQYVPSVLKFLEELANDPNRDDFVLSKAVGLIGDLAQSLGPQIRDEINKQFVAKLLNDAMASGDQSMAEILEEAKDA